MVDSLKMDPCLRDGCVSGAISCLRDGCVLGARPCLRNYGVYP